METLLIVVVGGICTAVGSISTAFAISLINKKRERSDVRKSDAEAADIESKTEQTTTEWYREQVKELTGEMRSLKTDFKDFKTSTDIERETYQRQAGSLLTKMDSMSLEQQLTNTQLTNANTKMDLMSREQERTNTQLVDANNRLEAANTIIQSLRDEISGLREQITELLVERAEKK